MNAIFKILIIIVLICLNQSNVFSQEEKNVEFYYQIKNYDLSTVIMADSVLAGGEKMVKRAEILGFIDDDFQRLYIDLVSIIQNKSNPYEYFAYGKTTVKNTTCEFLGTLTIKEAKLYSTGDSSEKYQQGYATCEVALYENPNQQHTGAIKGKWKSSFFIETQGKLQYNAIDFATNDFCNNQFTGTWTNYTNGISKKCNWGDYRIPESQDFDVGAEKFAVDEKYIKNGWQSYMLEHNLMPENTANTEVSTSIYSQTSDVEKYAAKITKKDLEEIVTTLCQSEFEGRRFGSVGNKKAAEYIVAELNKRSVPKSDGSRYEQFFKEGDKYGTNIIGIIEGSVYPDQSVIISCHYDGLGIVDNVFFPSADDNATGVAALIEIAGAFSAAALDGIRPKRSIIFAAFDAGKNDMRGSKIYSNYPIKPIDKAKILLNMDMLGRDDCGLKVNESNYVFLLLNNPLSSALRKISDSINAAYTQLNIEYDFYKNKQVWDLFYPTSDHHVFSYRLPTIFYTGGVNADVHSKTDTADKISYSTLRRRAQLVFYTAWDYANRTDI